MSRNHDDEEVIQATDAPRLMQDVKQMELDLQRKKRQLQQLRRRFLLASIENCSSDSTLCALWQKLKPEEQQDNDILYKFLSCDYGTDESLFGLNPWFKYYGEKWRRMNVPEKFLSDPQAVLAFISNDRILPRDGARFTVNRRLGKNKELMMAICSKFPSAFIHASPELRDDDDLVRVALLQQATRSENIRHVSERLRMDKKTMLYAVTMGYSTPCFALSWINSLPLGNMEIKQQKEIARGMIRIFTIAYSNGCDHQDFRFLSKFSPDLLEDVDFMLPFVELSWMALRWCSHRLRSNMWHMEVVRVAVSKSCNAYQYTKGPILQQYERNRSVASVLDELEKGLFFDNVPESLQVNKDIVMAAWKAGNEIEIHWDSGLPEALQIIDKDFILQLIAATPKDFDVGNSSFYYELPVYLRTDEDIANALLKARFPNRVEILETVPSLLRSREAMMNAVALPGEHYYEEEEEFAELAGRCAFLDDEEFMLKAYKSDHDTFQHASERLRSNRNFLESVLEVSNNSSTFIILTTDEFQAENQDFVASVIERDDGAHDSWWWFKYLNEVVWSSKEVVMAMARGKNKNWSVLKHIASIEPNSPMLHDKDVVFQAVKNRPAELEYASQAVRKDRDFILSLVHDIDGVLLHVPACLKNDKEIVLTAVARESGAISECFDSFELGKDFEFLVGFASEIRSAIATHNSFVAFLGGIHAYDPDCSLSVFDLGAETDAALKRTIAEYAGIRFPMGPSFRSLTAALANMEKVGF